LPNSLFEEQALAGRLGWLGAVSTLERSPAYGSSRLDFLVRSPRRRPLLVETKSCTRVADGTGLFPDARTARGARHMAELARAVREGYRAAVVFVVQREDAVSLRPADGDDPAFGSALREARKAGVAVRAFRCRVSLHEVALADEIPVLLGG
jgi:sugar fermentation stimulation protein A